MIWIGGAIFWFVCMSIYTCRMFYKEAALHQSNFYKKRDEVDRLREEIEIAISQLEGFNRTRALETLTEALGVSS